MSQVHPLARTTPRTRSEIRHSKAPATELAKTYNISVATARKWKARDDVLDRSHRAHELGCTLSPAQEAIVLELRRLCLLPLDDLVSITRRFVNPQASRSGVSRLLRRAGMARLTQMQPPQDGQDKPQKSFKDYVPGFVHIDIKYLPQMADEASRRYLFVAIDRATRWVFLRIYKDQSQASSTDFLRRLGHAAAFRITKILTDNGSQFTDRFTSKGKEPSGQHAFDLQCKAQGIEHRLAPPRHPQTNGMVERFNGRISEVVKQTRFTCAADLESTLTNYLNIYNHHIPQRALDHLSPIESLQAWRKKSPDLFVKRVYKQAALDS